MRVMEMGTLPRAAVAGLAIIASICGVSDAGAASLWASACYGDATEKNNFNAGAQVCASGDVDYVPPGQICGAGDLYVIPKDYSHPFADVTLGGANFFSTCLGAGAFIDQSMWLPPLKPGQYEIVLDQTPFWDPDNSWFDPSRDIRGVYFNVSNAPIVFSCDPAAIKFAAAQSAHDAAMIQRTVTLIKAIQLLQGLVSAKTAAGVAYKLFCETLSQLKSPISCPSQIWDWTQGQALGLLSNLGKALEQMYGDIANDPPDPNFLELVSLSMTDPLLAAKPWSSPIDNELSNRTAFTAQLLATQTSAYRAFLPTFEKVQGAQAAKSHLGLLLQTEKLIAYLDLATSSAEKIAVQIDAIVGLAGDEPSDDGAAWQTVIDDFVANGFSETDENFLRSFGAGDAEIAEAKQLLELYATDLALPSTVGYGSLAEHLKAQHQTMAAAVADLRAQAVAVRGENEPLALRLGPKVSITTPAQGTVGTKLTVNASATHFDSNTSLSYAWDTDLDGGFDDDTGASIDFVPTAGGWQLLSVQVTDTAGLTDVAFVIVDAVATNAPPIITGMSPADAAPFADVNAELAFHVDATDPDGDPLTITWQVDGANAGEGADFTWQMPDEEAHTIDVIVADDDLYSPDANAGLTVRSSKWKGATGEGGGGASAPSGSAAGGNAGTGGSGANSDTSSGCGCVVVGDSDMHAPWLALAMFGLFFVRRRR
jgi:MYXO-CTERM domain-containing protein